MNVVKFYEIVLSCIIALKKIIDFTFFYYLRANFYNSS